MSNSDNSQTGIFALFTVKNEWPILGLSIPHALLNYAEKVIVIDTGSTDATLAGLEFLERLWPGRIIVYKYSPSKFDQASLLNILLVIAEELGSNWNVILDADEFLYCPDFEKFKMALPLQEADVLGYALKVNNFAVSEKFNEYEASSYSSVTAKVTGKNAASFPMALAIPAISSRKALPHTLSTPDKLILRTGVSAFASQGNHQLVFGDGRNWEKWDPRIKSSANLGLEIFHLPYTSKRRFDERNNRTFFDGLPRFWEVYANETKEGPDSFFDKTIVHSADIQTLVKDEVISLDARFADLVSSTILFLEKEGVNFEQIAQTKASGTLAHGSLDLEIVSKIVRKFYDKAFEYWTKPSAH